MKYAPFCEIKSTHNIHADAIIHHHVCARAVFMQKATANPKFMNETRDPLLQVCVHYKLLWDACKQNVLRKLIFFPRSGFHLNK